MIKNRKLIEYADKFSDVPKKPSEIFLHVLDKLSIKEKDLKKIRSEADRISKIKKHKISIVFYFTPQATPRPRISKHGISFYVKNLVDYNKVFKEFVTVCDSIKGIITTPTRFVCRTYAPIPSGMNRIDQVLAEIGFIPNISRPDWDNLGKTYSDMIQKHLLLEDALIYDGRVIKGYSARPRIEMEIEYYDDYVCNFIEKKIKSWKQYSDNN